jgi:hypothetical protein
LFLYDFIFLIKIRNERTIGDWGLGIGDWGLGIGPNPQSPIPNPQSPIPKAPELAIMTNNPTSNPLMVKKMEEFESHYNDMCRGFNNLVSKYKMLKEEKNKMEDSSLKLLSRYSQLEKQYEETIRELYSKYDEIKRFKEVDKCLVDYTLNSFMLRVDPKEVHQRNSLNNNSSAQLDPPGIKCEPLPTFAKFLANKK